MGLDIGMARPRFDLNGPSLQQEGGKAQSVAFAFEADHADRFTDDPDELRRALGTASAGVFEDSSVDIDGETFTVRGVNTTVHGPSRMLFEVWWRSLKAARHNPQIDGDISWASGVIIEDETERKSTLSKVFA